LLQKKYTNKCKEKFVILQSRGITIQRKILVEENFGEFGDLLQIRQSFIRQLLVISEKAIEAGLKSAKVFFAKIFRYTV